MNSIAELFNAPENIRKTQYNKNRVRANINFMEWELEFLKKYVERIPEEDDARHAELVQHFADNINSACEILLNARKDV